MERQYYWPAVLGMLVRYSGQGIGRIVEYEHVIVVERAESRSSVWLVVAKTVGKIALGA